MYRADGRPSCAGRRDGVRQRRRGDERQRRLRPDAGLCRHRRLRRPDAGRADRAVLEAHVDAGDGRFRGIRHRRPGRQPRGANSHTTRRTGSRPIRLPRGPGAAWRARPLLRGLALSSAAADLLALARAVPEPTMVLNHCGGPLGIGPYAGRRDAVSPTGSADMAELARCPNVVVKLGGLGMDIGEFDHCACPSRRRRAAGRRLAALHRDLHRGLRRRALHVREQLPRRQGLAATPSCGTRSSAWRPALARPRRRRSSAARRSGSIGCRDLPDRERPARSDL